MAIEGYNKTSGRKTLILVILIMMAIIFLSIYSVYLMLRKSAVVTNSSYYERPEVTITPTPTSIPEYPYFPQRNGD